MQESYYFYFGSINRINQCKTTPIFLPYAVLGLLTKNAYFGFDLSGT